MDLIEALSQLDPSNDAHWTAQDLARLEVVSEMVGRDLSRREVTAAAPDFNRKSPVLPGQPEPVPALPESAPADVVEAVAETREKLQARLAETQDMIAERRDAIAAEQRALADLIDQEAAVADKMQERYPELSPAEKMKRHTQRQHEIRVKAAMTAQGAGQPVPAASPLDAVMTRRERPFSNPAPRPVPPQQKP